MQKKWYVQYKNISFFNLVAACVHISLNYSTVKSSLLVYGLKGLRLTSLNYALWLICDSAVWSFSCFVRVSGFWRQVLLHPGLDHRKLLAELLGHYYLCIGKEQSNALIKHILVNRTVGGSLQVCSLKYHTDKIGTVLYERLMAKLD